MFSIHVPQLRQMNCKLANVKCSIMAYWCNTGHVYEAEVQPRNPPTTLPFPFDASRSARSSLLPWRDFTTEMAAKVCRSVLLLSRSNGAVAGSFPALVVSSQRHHQHIRPVSPRTSALSGGEGGGWGDQAGGQAGLGEKAAVAFFAG